jgi:hypothetical protein
MTEAILDYLLSIGLGALILAILIADVYVNMRWSKLGWLFNLIILGAILLMCLTGE